MIGPQHGLHDRRRRRSHRRGRRARQSRCCSSSSAPAGKARLVTTRNVIEVGAGARATIIEAHVALPGAAPGQANSAEPRSRSATARTLTHVKCTLDGSRAQPSRHLDGDARRGCRLSRLPAHGRRRGSPATASRRPSRAKAPSSTSPAAFLGRGAEHIDTTLVVDHAVPGCESRELFKGVLADRARGVFQGKVIVRPDAQKTDGKQMAQALMLSEDAEFNSKPELEIYADDVVCGHGSTAAEIDEDMLFYLRSRGIPLAEARALLIESFIGEAIDKVEDERLREALSADRQARRLRGADG